MQSDQGRAPLDRATGEHPLLAEHLEEQLDFFNRNAHEIAPLSDESIPRARRLGLGGHSRTLAQTSVYTSDGVRASANGVDHPDEVFEVVAALAGELHEFACLVDNRALIRGCCDGDTPAPTKLDDSFLAQGAERPQRRIGVYAEDGRKVACGRKTIARFRLAISDCAPDLARDLQMQIEGVVAIHLDTKHGAINISSIPMKAKALC
jgi:hypothetical protein